MGLKTLTKYGIPLTSFLALLLLIHEPTISYPTHPGITASNQSTLLHTTLDDVDSITNPAIGLGGTSTLSAGDFIFTDGRHGAFLNDSSKVIRFPTSNGVIQNIELDHGELEFWYRPNYDASSDDVIHQLVVVGNLYNPPNIILSESDRLSISITDAAWTNYTAQAAYRAALWSAGQWIHIRATWDNTGSDPLGLYVNGVRVDAGASTSGWNLGSETTIGEIFVGSGSNNGEFSANGILDELIIRNMPVVPPSATPTIPPTATNTTDPSLPTATNTPIPTLTPTPTTRPGGGIPNPDLILTPAELPEQPYNTTFNDPVFGTTLRRVTNLKSTGVKGSHIYSQLQVISYDNQYILLEENEDYVVRRLSDLVRMNLDTSGWNAPRWLPGTSHAIIHYDSNEDTVLRVQTTDVLTNTTTTVFTFPYEYERIRGNQSFDELSEDGRWMAGMASRSDGVQVIFALDLKNLILGVELAIPDFYSGPCLADPIWGQVEPDWIAISPLGRYLVVQWVRFSTARCSGLETFDLTNGAFVGRVTEDHQHGDLGVLPDGMTEFFMTFEIYHPSGNGAIGIRELPGTSTSSPPSYLQITNWNGAHISCRGPNGVCLVTMEWDTQSGWMPLEGELFLQYTDGRVLRLVHHRSSSCGYWVQPRASLSADGRYIVFTSDWGFQSGSDSCGGGNDMGLGDVYVLDLMPGTSPNQTTLFFPLIVR